MRIFSIILSWPGTQLPALIMASFVLSGCLSSGSDSTAEFSISTPDRFTLAVDPAALSVNVIIDGRRYTLNRGLNNSQWAGNLTLPTERELELSVEWFYDNLLVARYNQTLDPITEPVRLEVSSDQYITTGVEFDQDADGTSNLAEIQNNTNPLDAQNIDMVIPKLGPGDVIGVNGVTGDTWARFISSEWDSSVPAIDNLMINRGALREDGETEFYWQAAHNGTYLFVIVYGERTDQGMATPIRDSLTPTRDDAVRLFFDGNNSKLSSYDGVDDLYLTTPLLALRRPADSQLAQLQPVVSDNGDYQFDDRRFILMGDPAAPSYVEPATTEANDIELPNAQWIPGPPGNTPAVSLEGLDFHHGTESRGSQVYEFRLPLEALNIQIGRPFGFEVQIDSDHNGGNSDAKYGWKHPSRTNTGDVNFTEQDPSYFGTVVLQE
ncbi:MAG: sugar-binding protein [Pseudomonadota bacterium]